MPTLSGGEAQRLKIAGHLAEALDKKIKGALLIFDEPTTGLHFDDIAKLLKALQALKAAGHSLLVVEQQESGYRSRLEQPTPRRLEQFGSLTIRSSFYASTDQAGTS